ncbi:probable pectinesterase 66 [Lotus japonicus]|uniref:probable pectinesterase 66 n=1 Tax=Lotus japonicus TaxID=34305 RepID=UPI002584EC95|nr:probable pectinesterase 66 [Lotus japonicus]
MNCGGNQVAKTLTIDRRGKGDFKTIQAGIDSVKKNNGQWVKIHIKSGIYMEKVSIPKEKPCIILEGDNSHKTIITCNDHRLTTSWGATFVSTAPNVIVSGITFKNSFNLVRGNLPGTRTKIEPAAAAVVYGDQSYFYKCSFLGYQDTLMAANGRHYFKDCYIQGEVDFIAGAGQSYFKVIHKYTLRLVSNTLLS